MKRCFALLGLLLCCSLAWASPLTLYYSVTDLGTGSYQYNFTLTLVVAIGTGV